MPRRHRYHSPQRDDGSFGAGYPGGSGRTALPIRLSLLCRQVCLHLLWPISGRRQSRDTPGATARDYQMNSGNFAEALWRCSWTSRWVRIWSWSIHLSLTSMSYERSRWGGQGDVRHAHRRLSGLRVVCHDLGRGRKRMAG